MPVLTDGWESKPTQQCIQNVQMGGILKCTDVQMGGMGAKTNVAKPFNDAAASCGSGLLVNLPALVQTSPCGEV